MFRCRSFAFPMLLAVLMLLLSLSAWAVVPNPSPQQTAAARAQNFCSDPWVTLAIADVTGGGFPKGVAGLGQCDIQLYNGGQWANFDQLVQAVNATLRGIPYNTFSMVDNHNGTMTIVTDAGGGYQKWVQVTGRIVSQGGGNIVAQGGGNIIGQDGASIILNGGGNYRLQSNSQKAVTLPGGRVLIITKANTPPRH